MTDGSVGVRWRTLLPGRKDDRRRDPRAATAAFVVDRCESLPLGETSALLRVSGRWTSGVPHSVDLVGDDGTRVSPVPPGPQVASDGTWSAGFELPAGAPERRLALGTDGFWTELPSASSLAPPSRPAYADALDELQSARTVIAQLRERCDVSERGLADFRDKLAHAWEEASHMRTMLDTRETAYETALARERQAVAVVDELRASLRRSEEDLTASRQELEAECRRLREELAGRPKLDPQAAARADEALEQLSVARARSAQLEAQLVSAQSIAEDTLQAAGRGARELTAARIKADEAAARAEQYADQFAGSERMLGEVREELAAAHARIAELEAAAADSDTAHPELRERLAHAERACAALATSEQEARQELALLTRTDLGAPTKGLSLRRSKVSALAYREALANLEAEQEARARLEAHATQLADRVSQLESEVAAYHTNPLPAAVEADLRHLVAKRE